MECFEKYEEMFGEPIALPFELPADKKYGDFLNAVKDCIEKKEPYDPKKYGFYIGDDIIV